MSNVDVMMPASLTARQAEILAIIGEFYRKHGFPPTYRIIGGLAGITTTNAVMCHIRPLVRKGAIRRVQFGSSVHYLPVVPDGCCPCCGRPD